jgi:hypothetical protein
MTNTISAANNPALANNIIQQALQEEPPSYEPQINAPSDTAVELPGGYITPTGEVLRTAEVRELTGRDEEAISKTTSMGKALLTVLQRGTVKIGDVKADEKVLDDLLAGDRDALLLGIIKATFGPDVEIPSYCGGCQEMKTVSVNLVTDIKTKILTNPIEDRLFTVEGKRGDILVQLPTGRVQKELINNSDKTSAELNTIVLENTVLKIGDKDVISKAQVQNLGVADRRKVTEEINKRASGPQFEDLTMSCPDCEGEVTVPINLGTLFRF